ncbi:hypothetical protein H2203_003888 [Taxawa tesnikishii (nom. ined.)]|nr:hypothetical protein H2203_003888 [Dothideales sp. JES 119]
MATSGPNTLLWLSSIAARSCVRNAAPTTLRHAAYTTTCKSFGPLRRFPTPTSKPASSLCVSVGAQSWPTLQVSRSPSVRQASTTPEASSTELPSDPGSALSWDEFLKLRRTRRHINLGASAVAAITSVAVSVPIIGAYDIETIGYQMTGMDPFIVLGIATGACGVVGWLMGPFLGNAVFTLWKSSVRGEFLRVSNTRRSRPTAGHRERKTADGMQKEKQFYAHIKRFRADPTSSSVNNPVPDYYGEKIGSVADYKRWLKDQQAFLRKKDKNLL